MDRFVSNLKSKLQIAFGDANECIRFMDLNNSETVRIEEFMFAVQFFISGAGITDIILLFNQLDTNRDGMLDLDELSSLMPKVD
jgi:Ca2+-binding EF-hand superfamily protein